MLDKQFLVGYRKTYRTLNKVQIEQFYRLVTEHALHVGTRTAHVCSAKRPRWHTPMAPFAPQW